MLKSTNHTTFDSVEKFGNHESNVFNSLLSSRYSRIKSHTVVKLSAALVYDSVEEGERRGTGVRGNFERQEADYFTADYVEVGMVFFVDRLGEFLLASLRVVFGYVQKTLV